MFRVIGITRPDFFEGEAARISELLASHRVDLIHVRKPEATQSQVASLLSQLSAQERRCVMIHDFFPLAPQFGLRGIHLNGRHSQIPVYIHSGFKVSCGCHSFGELMTQKARTDADGLPLMDYLFLSPIFDSISKHGYRSTFAPQVLAEAGKRGVIDQRVVALGGVRPAKFDQLSQWHFGGAAMLGNLW
jgi:thiamine-phosphate pyrophosphorylase